MTAIVFHYHKSSNLKNNMSLLFQDRHKLWTCQRQGTSQSDKLLLERAREDQNGDDACWSNLFLVSMNCTLEKIEWKISFLIYYLMFSLYLYWFLFSSCFSYYRPAFHDLSSQFAVRLHNVKFSGLVMNLQQKNLENYGTLLTILPIRGIGEVLSIGS